MPFERPEIIRPPSEHASYFLPLTSGCSNNTCIFCNFYGSKLRIRDVGEVKRELDAMVSYAREGRRAAGIPDIVYMILRSWDGRRVFLQDGDALVYPHEKLIEVLNHLNACFPDLNRIASYATPRDILNRSVEELKSLKERKLGILYMGIESGDDEILKWVGKRATHDEIVQAGRKIKEAGIISSVTVILGLGGREKSEQHVRQTARVLTEVDPDYVGALTLTFVPGTPLDNLLQKGEFSPLTPFEYIQELKGIIELSTFSNCFFSSVHASNYLTIRAHLPQDKERAVAQLEQVLMEKDQRLLRPEFMRGL